MKILHVTRQFYPAVGGIENVALGLCRALQARGHECTVATLRTDFGRGTTLAPEAVVEGIPVHRFRHVGPRRYPVAPAVLGLVRAHDLVHVHGIDFFVDWLSLTRAWHRRPLVISTHGGIFHTRWHSRFKTVWFRTVTRFSLTGVRAVICVSAHDDTVFARIVGPSKRHVLTNGVDVAAFTGVRKLIEPGLLVGIGRLAVNKRVDRLVALLPEFPAVRLAWIGEDVSGMAAALREQARALGVADRLSLLGPLPPEALRDWLARAACFVSAAEYEAFAVSTVEAMASGTVPLVTPVGIHPEAVRDGENGWIWDFDRNAGAALSRALATDEQDLMRMGEAARRTAQRYAWEHVVDGYLAVYHAALER